VGSGCLLLLLAIVYLGRDPYYLGVLITILININLAVSLLPLLRTGLFSIAHAAMAAIGAYTSALLVAKAGVIFWVSFPVAGIASGLFAVIIGFPTLRIRGLFFLLVTLGMNEIVRLTLNNWVGFTGGPSGITDIPGISPIFGIAFSSRTEYFYFALGLAAFTFLFLYRLWNSRFGKVCHAIAENEELCQSFGINVMKYKMTIFGICCFFAGLTGAFFAHYYQFISPEEFTVWHSIYPLIYLKMGGVASFAGPVIGATLLTSVTEIFRFMEIYKPIVYGGIMIVFMMIMPEGIVGFPEMLNKFSEKKQRRKNLQ
jgi:branched-chain amino acid transport system permease protein